MANPAVWSILKELGPLYFGAIVASLITLGQSIGSALHDWQKRHGR